MKVLVCGGRDFNDYDLLDQILSEVYAHRKRDSLHFTIISGCARGADSLAIKWVENAGPYDFIKLKKYPADWAKFGKSAGPIRNQQMLDEGKPDLVVAFPGGNGTADMVRRAKKAGIEVMIIEVEE